MSMSYLISGVDLLSLPCITKADVQQAITQAKPTETIGFLVVSDTAPDVVSTPEFANFIWLESNLGVPTGLFYYYNGTSWTLLNTVNGAHLANNSVALSKLSLAGAAAYNIIQVNAAGNALIWTSIINAIQNGTIPLNKLVGGGGLDNKVLVSLANTNQYIDLASLVNYFAANSIAISKLVRGGASAHGLFLRTFEDGTTVEWVDFDPNEQIDDNELSIQKLSYAGFAALQSIRRNAGNTAWEGFTPDAQPVLKFGQLLDEVASGNLSQTFVYGSWQTKRLNALDNPDSIITSLAGNQFILAAGTYRVSGYAAVQQCTIRMRIKNMTSGNPLLQGVQFSMANNDTGIVTIDGLIIVAAAQTLQLQYYATNNGLGAPFPMCGPMTTGESEMYAQLSLTKIA